MRKLPLLILILGGTLLAVSQSDLSKYRPGTIMAVEPHHSSSSDNAAQRKYDISLKVGNTTYVLLYTQPPGTISPEYRTGLELPVLVLSNSIRFNDGLGRSRELPIESHRATQ